MLNFLRAHGADAHAREEVRKSRGESTAFECAEPICELLYNHKRATDNGSRGGRRITGRSVRHLS